MDISKKSFDYFLSRDHKERGIVLLNLCGDCSDVDAWEKWLEEITDELIKERIVSKSANFKNIWKEVFVLQTTSGRKDLVLFFGKIRFVMRRMTAWKVKFEDCCWVSDYASGYWDQHVKV